MSWKRVLIGCLSLAVAVSAQGEAAKPKKRVARLAGPAAKTPEELRERLSAKLAEPWVAKGGWELDYDEALARAVREDKKVLTYFTRSYAP